MSSGNKVRLALLVLMLPYTATADRSGEARVFAATSTSVRSAFSAVPTFIPARALSINGIVIATVNARDVSLSTGNSTTDPARTANQIVGTGGITNPRGDGSSNIRTVFFEILGACIGVATLIVAILALRAMPKKHLHDPESPPVTENGNSPPVGTELEQLPSHGASTSDQEPGMVQPTVDTQSQETESSE